MMELFTGLIALVMVGWGCNRIYWWIRGRVYYRWWDRQVKKNKHIKQMVVEETAGVVRRLEALEMAHEKDKFNILEMRKSATQKYQEAANLKTLLMKRLEGEIITGNHLRKIVKKEAKKQ